MFDEDFLTNNYITGMAFVVGFTAFFWANNNNYSSAISAAAGILAGIVTKLGAQHLTDERDRKDAEDLERENEMEIDELSEQHEIKIEEEEFDKQFINQYGHFPETPEESAIYSEGLKKCVSDVQERNLAKLFKH